MARCKKYFRKVNLAEGRKTEEASQSDPVGSSGRPDLYTDKVSLWPTLEEVAISLLK